MMSGVQGSPAVMFYFGGSSPLLGANHGYTFLSPNTDSIPLYLGDDGGLHGGWWMIDNRSASPTYAGAYETIDVYDVSNASGGWYKLVFTAFGSSYVRYAPKVSRARDYDAGSTSSNVGNWPVYTSTSPGDFSVYDSSIVSTIAFIGDFSGIDVLGSATQPATQPATTVPSVDFKGAAGQFKTRWQSFVNDRSNDTYGPSISFVKSFASNLQSANVDFTTGPGDMFVTLLGGYFNTPVWGLGDKTWVDLMRPFFESFDEGVKQVFVFLNSIAIARQMLSVVLWLWCAKVCFDWSYWSVTGKSFLIWERFAGTQVGRFVAPSPGDAVAAGGDGAVYPQLSVSDVKLLGDGEVS